MKVYIFNDQGKYMGEAIEDFGISYVNKTHIAPDENFLNGDYDVIWNGKEWKYITLKTEEPATFITEPTEEEIQAQEAENERLRQERLAQQANDLLPHIWKLIENKLNE